MELKDLFKVIKKHKNVLLSFAVLGVILGALVYSLPTKYISTGSLYIKRAADTSTNFFTYEGYYSQQTALSYTSTVVGLLESVDIQSKALNKLNIPVDETTLRKYARYIKVKKSSPQIVELTVKGNSVESSKNLWEAVANEAVVVTQQLNANGDNKLDVSKISSQPVVKREYKSLWINIPAGILLALGLGVFIVSLKEYD
jgi:capsular polysaccharide biosynthesis protein